MFTYFINLVYKIGYKVLLHKVYILNIYIYINYNIQNYNTVNQKLVQKKHFTCFFIVLLGFQV